MRYVKAFTAVATAALALTFTPVQAAEKRTMCAVSYTHLTLPTICSV